MSTDYLPYKSIRKKIEGITTETNTDYKTKSELVSYGKTDTSRLSGYQNKDYVIDDDILSGSATANFNITASLNGYTVGEISSIRITCTSTEASNITINCTY